MILFMLGCYLSPSQQSVCHATRPSPSPTVRIAILSIFRGERCQIGAALAEEPECPVNPQWDPMSIACNERNRTAPPSGRIHSIRRRFCFMVKDIVAYSSVAEQRHIPRLTEQNTSRIAIIAYCRVFPPRGQRFPRYSRAFDCCIALGGIYGERGRVVRAAASCNRRIKSAHQLRSGGPLGFATR